MKKSSPFFLLLAALLAAACDDEKKPAPEPMPAPAGVVFDWVQQTSFTVSWIPVEAAGAYAYRLLRVASGESVTLLKAENDLQRTQATFTDLDPGTEYTFEVRTRHASGVEFGDSERVKAVATTLPADAGPWVDVKLSYVELGDKGTLQIENRADAACAHFYSTTANVNVIGEGHDDEATFIDYMIQEYETHAPGVYRDAVKHDFNDNGAGFVAGDRLFFGVAGVDAAGTPGDLNWCWVEIPAKPGDPVIVLDALGKGDK